MGPGNPGKPWKIFEALEIPGKALESRRILLKKYIRQMVHFQGSTIRI